MHITRDIKTQNINVRFRITEFRDNVLHTKIIGYRYLSAAIKRLVRRRMTRIDDSIILESKGGQPLKIKPMLLTRGKVSKLIDHKIRMALREDLAKYASKNTYEEVFLSIIKNRLQTELKNKFSKIYPVRALLIRVLEVENKSQTSSKKKHAENTAQAVQEKPDEKDQKIAKQESEQKKKQEKSGQAKSQKSSENKQKQGDSDKPKKEKNTDAKKAAGANDASDAEPHNLDNIDKANKQDKKE